MKRFVLAAIAALSMVGVCFAQTTVTVPVTGTVTLTIPAGPAGPAGPQGPQGIQGPAGPQGPAGTGVSTPVAVGATAASAVKLSNPHTYECVAGDNTAGLKAAIGTTGDVVIDNASNPCTVTTGPILIPSNKNVTGAHQSLVLTFTNQDNQTSLFKFDNVSNSSLSNMTIAETPAASPFGWNAKTSGSSYTSFNFPVLIGNYTGPVSNITVTGVVFQSVRAQAAIETYSSGGSAVAPTNITLDYNTMNGCGIYGIVYDTAASSHADYNIANDCLMGAEMDNSTQSITASTMNFNQISRDATSTGYGSVCKTYSTNCDQYFSGITTGGPGNYSGLTFTGNVVTGGGFLTNIREGGYDSNFVNNSCTNVCSVTP